jgi:hypothetical protein
MHTFEGPPLRPGDVPGADASAYADRDEEGPLPGVPRTVWATCDDVASPRALPCHAANKKPWSSGECVQPEKAVNPGTEGKYQTRGAHMRAEDLTIAMIERCREMILEHEDLGRELPEPLRSRHLVAMCDRLTEHVDDWTAVKLSRWIGFLQCAMIANRMIDLEGAKEMFDQAKNAFGESSRDVLDHLDPDQAFEFEIGGEG